MTVDDKGTNGVDESHEEEEYSHDQVDFVEEDVCSRVAHLPEKGEADELHITLDEGDEHGRRDFWANENLTYELVAGE